MSLQDDRTAAFGDATPPATLQDARTAAFSPGAPPPAKSGPSVFSEDPINAAVGGFVRQSAASAGATIAGGLRGLYDLATGEGSDKAAQDVEETAGNSLGYRPASPAEAAGARAAGSSWNPLNWSGMLLHHAGNVVASDIEKELPGTPPAVLAGIETAPTAAALVTKPLRSANFEPYEVAAENPAPTAADVATRSAQSSPQSSGAAAAAPRLSAASAPLQQGIVSAAQKTGGAVNSDALLNHVEADSHGIQLMAGQASRDPAQFSAEQNSTDAPIVERINKQEQQMVDAIDNIRREAGPGTVQNDAIQNGQAVIDDLKNYDAPIKADIKAKYQALTDANGGSVPIDTKAFTANVDAALKKQYLTSSVPAAGAELLNSLRNGEPLDFEGFEAARSRLAEAQRKGGSEGVAAGIIRNQLEQLPLSPQAANLKGLADTARSAAKARFDALDADPAYEAAVSDSAKVGQPSALADKFLTKYALNAPKANLDLLMQKLSPDGQEAVTSHTLSTIRDAAITPNGRVSPNGYNGALEKYGPKLESLVPPATQESLESLGRVITNAKVAPPGNYVNYSKSGVIMNAAQAGAEAAINAKTLGLGVPVLKGMARRKWVRDTLAPGAGLDQIEHP